MVESFIKPFLDAYRNEKNTRRLLPFAKKAFYNLRFKIAEQVDYLHELKQEKQLLVIYEQEIENLKYFLCDYLKIRLQKLQKDLYAFEEVLSDEEKKFYEKLLAKYKQMDFYKEETEKKKDKECVGFIAQTDIGNVLIEGNTVDISYGDFFVVKFEDIEELLTDQKISLV